MSDQETVAASNNVGDYYARRNAAAEALIKALGGAKKDLNPMLSVGGLNASQTAAADWALQELQRLAPLQEPESYDEGGGGKLMQYLRQYAQLDAQARALEDQLDDINRRKNRLTGGDEQNGPLLEAWLHEGMKNINIAGRTFYLHVDKRLKRKEGVTPKAALTVLRRAGMSGMITESANSNSLKSWYTDLIKAGKKMSPAIARCWEVFERSSIRSRKS